jgi:formylglycine-generating enzyme required for sulfatase activity
MALTAWVIIHFSLAPRQPAQASAPAGKPGTAAAAVHNAGETRLNRRDGETYVWVAPGHFRMGCSPGDSDCHDDEPAHDVTLSKGYWIGQTEASTGAYRRFSRAVGRDMPAAPDFNPQWSNDQMPITGISWDDANTFCRWALGRLPTEAEWEYAARAGSPELRYGPLDEVAWHKGNSNSKAHPVKGRQPNAFGLYDMLGNLWEWTADRYNKDAYLSGPRNDPQGPPTGNFHILRGGSWLRDANEVRVSGRYPVSGDNPDHVIGFRCVADDLP